MNIAEGLSRTGVTSEPVTGGHRHLAAGWGLEYSTWGSSFPHLHHQIQPCTAALSAQVQPLCDSGPICLMPWPHTTTYSSCSPQPTFHNGYLNTYSGYFYHQGSVRGAEWGDPGSIQSKHPSHLYMGNFSPLSSCTEVISQSIHTAQWILL